MRRKDTVKINLKDKSNRHTVIIGSYLLAVTYPQGYNSKLYEVCNA